MIPYEAPLIRAKSKALEGSMLSSPAQQAVLPGGRFQLLDLEIGSEGSDPTLLLKCQQLNWVEFPVFGWNLPREISEVRGHPWLSFSEGSSADSTGFVSEL